MRKRNRRRSQRPGRRSRRAAARQGPGRSGRHRSKQTVAEQPPLATPRGELPSSHDLLAYMREGAYRPLTLGDMVHIFGLDKPQRRQLKALLAELEATGDIVQTRTKRYGVPERMNLVVGRLQGHQRGFGFVIPARGGTGDLFISAQNMGTAMHDDRVVARILTRGGPQGQRPEGEIIRVLQRANHRIVGTLDRTRRYGFVTPADNRLGPDIFVALADLGSARTGEVVVVEITRWPEGRRSAEGRVVERLGQEGHPGVDMAVIMVKYDLEQEFPRAVQRQVRSTPAEVRAEDLEGRLDLRSLTTFTIDGADARDLDDAVSLEPLADGRRARWRVGVHIADVSHYVPAETPLDLEARRRGTSVYLPDRVVPMLPPQLSNGICSLDPGVDRLTLSLLVDLDDDGQVVDHQLTPAVIRSQRRFTYDEVAQIIATGPADGAADRHQRARPAHGPAAEEELAAALLAMHQLAQARFTQRLQRGSIDFDFPEAKIVMDEAGVPVHIEVERRNAATQLIEEFMIMANEVVAQQFTPQQIPFLYRIHEPPTLEAAQSLQSLLALFGHQTGKLRSSKVKPRDFQAWLQRVQGRPEEYLIQVATLRSLQRALYSTDSLGHFGLASNLYSHFTAPIRRYPDLMLHRIIKLQLSGQLVAGQRDELGRLLPDVAADASAAERQAEEAEREATDLKKAQYMQQFIGDEFSGFVSGIMPFGMFVQLPNTVEGLVHVSTMTDDYYEFVEEHLMLLGERTGKIYRPGHPVRVQVAGVDLANRSVDFLLIDEEE